MIRWGPAVTEDNAGTGGNTRAAAKVERKGQDTSEQEMERGTENIDKEALDDSDEDEGEFLLEL